MNSADILTLVRAGFSREEILGMDQPQPDPQPQPQPQPQPDPQPDPQPQPQPQPQPDPQPQQVPKTQPQSEPLQAVLAAIQEQNKTLLAAIQGNNRDNARQPTTPTLTGEDVLAQIIRPTYNQQN